MDRLIPVITTTILKEFESNDVGPHFGKTSWSMELSLKALMVKGVSIEDQTIDVCLQLTEGDALQLIKAMEVMLAAYPDRKGLIDG